MVYGTLTDAKLEKAIAKAIGKAVKIKKAQSPTKAD